MYVRFIVAEVHDDSIRELGVFQAAYRLRRAGKLRDYEEARLNELLSWFNTNLAKPEKFTKSKPPYDRKQQRAISWFKDSAQQHIARIRELAAILDSHDIHFEMIQTDRPGYIVYEDAHQIVAEPFADAEF